MHSRIIAASEKKDNLCNISEATFYGDDDVRVFSDYISNVGDDDTPAIWLDRPGIVYDKEERTLTLVDKKAYFVGKYDEFRECLEKLGTATLEQFSTGGAGFDFEMYRLRYLYDDNFEVHLYGLEYYGGICSLDTWVRDSPDGATIHIGNMVDYHY